jgi:hypothetical protein
MKTFCEGHGIILPILQKNANWRVIEDLLMNALHELFSFFHSKLSNNFHSSQHQNH